MKPTIVLTGFMGSGKTTVGRVLAARTGRVFVDTDELIALRAGRSIATIFAEDGEAAFREMEGEMAAELSGREDLVIATGGGMFLEPANVEALEKAGEIICLTARVDTLVRRLAGTGDERPLLSGMDPAESVQRILAERATVYAQFRTVDTEGKTAQAVCESIFDLLPEEADEITLLPLQTIQVQHPAGEYNVWIGEQILHRLRELIDIDGPLAVVTDSNVGPLFTDQLGAVDVLVTIPAGEQYKNLDTVQSIYTQLLAGGIDRSGTIVALGGGVVGDTAGFVAATYMRGLAFVQCPTTLLAMVDAAIGGKTGVDLPQGKNLVGAFKQPQAVLADLSTLRTLPPAEFAGGLAEVVKHGLLSAPKLLTWLENDTWAHHEATTPGRFGQLRALINMAMQVKRKFVQEDPFEGGLRALLNLGHTFAHAIEQVSHYQVGHGQAVAMGLVAAARLSTQLGVAEPSLQIRIEIILEHCYLPVRIPAEYSAENIYQAMFADKKKTAGRLRIVLLREVGNSFISAEVPAEILVKSIHAIQE